MGEIYGVIGYPIGHSLSPAMHNGVFKELKMDCYYQAFAVLPEALEETIRSMKCLGVKGFNVTTPHKVTIMEYLDKIDELALKIGAVNTVVYENGSYVGYNTDGVGYVTSLEQEMNIKVQGKKVMVIGAGGAARAIYYSLIEKGVTKIDLVNRTTAKGMEILDKSIDSAVYSLEEGASRTGDYDIIINTTTVGMFPHVNEMPFPLVKVNESAVISDIIYNPNKTLLLKQGEMLGARIHNGLGMFVYQGALAFEKWTGIFPPINIMRKIVIEKLGE